jgi:hypothetical protein
VEEKLKEGKPVTFNGWLEAGLRAVSVLTAAYPRSFDLQRLVAFDYLLVHTGDVGGPDSLHPPVPMHSAELLVRRKVVEHGLDLMMSRNLVSRRYESAGIRYIAGENAAPFMSSVASEYLLALKDRATWLVNTFGDYSDIDFKTVMRRFFEHWVEEFQAAERSLGAE